MAAIKNIDPKYESSDTAGRMKPKRKKGAKGVDPQFGGGKIEGRLTEEEAAALEAYMGDRFLTNKSDVLRSALAQFLVKEGYLQPPSSKVKRTGGGETSAKRSIVGGWSKLTRRIALIMTAAVAWFSTVSALSNPSTQKAAWRLAVANGDVRSENGTQVAGAIRDRLSEHASDLAQWFFDLEPAYQSAITAVAVLAVDLADGKLWLLGGLQLW
jgi:hypothetical protein